MPYRSPISFARFTSRVQHQTDLAFFTILALLFIGIALRQLEWPRLHLLIRSAFNSNLVQQQVRQERSLNRLFLLAFVFSLLSISLFMTLAFRRMGYFTDVHFGMLVLLMVVVLLLITTVRMAFYTLLAWVVELDELQQKHSVFMLQSNFLAGLVLFPLSVVLAYPWQGLSVAHLKLLAYIGLLALAAAFAWRLIRLWSAAAGQYRVLFIYNFLYVCALEILPLAVGARVVFGHQTG